MPSIRTLAWLSLAAAIAACADAPTQAIGGELAAIRVTVPAASIEVGHVAVATAVGADRSGGRVAVGGVRWASTNVAALTVDAMGRMRAVGPGRADVIATFDGVTGRAELTITGAVGISSVTVGTVGVGAPITVKVAAPRTIFVRYWDSTAAPPLTVTATVTRSQPQLTLYRLAPGRTYRYAVFTLPDTITTDEAFTGSFVTPALPPELASLSFSVSGATTDDLVAWEMRSASGWQGLVATNRRGEVVWYYRTVGSPQGVARRANGNFIINDTGRGLLEITIDGAVVHSADVQSHHDVLVTPQNTVLYIGKDNRVVPGFGSLAGDGIYEWSPETGTVQERFSTFDWFDPARDWGSRSQASDWLHANSISYGPHGNVILSLNWISEVVSIAPRWQSIEWRLGGWNSSYAIDADAAFSGQHAVSMPAEGRVLMFDNGRERTGADAYSRALEVALDAPARRASKAWAANPSPPIFAPFVGYSKRLANGNTLVHFGLSAGSFGGVVATGPIVLYEFTPTGAVSFRAEVKGGVSCYRSWTFSSLAGEHVVR